MQSEQIDSGWYKTALVGHNKSPLDIIQYLYDEATNWLDGEPVTNKRQADGLTELIHQLRSARIKADEARKEEAKPFDEGKKAVQDKYNPYIQPKKGMVDRAIQMAQDTLAPYLLEQKRLKDKKDAQLAADAQQAMTEAIDAMRESSGDLEAREEAEHRLKDAKEMQKIAKKAAKENIAKGAQSRWDVDLIDRTEAARYLWPMYAEQFDDLLLSLARDLVKLGKREIPGFEITERIVV